MAIVADPGTPTPSTFRIGFGAGAGASSLATWRCAARLAGREVRRRPGRTTLVVALVVLPTLAMTLGVVVARSNARWDSDPFTRDAGRVADLQVQLAVAPTDDRLAEVLPAGSRWLRYRSVGGTIRSTGPDGLATWASVTDLPVNDSLQGGQVILRSGTSPDPGEVVVTERLAGQLGVGVGDTLRLERPAGSWRVSGLAVTLSGFDDHRLVIPSFDWRLARPDSISETVLVDLPEEPDVATADALLASLGGGSARVRETWQAELVEVQAEELAWGWVAGVLGLVVVGIVIAAAFATSARRQLVTLGHLAAQGAPRPVVRRTLVLQGWWTGLLGATVGVGVGVAGLLLGRPWLERVWGRVIDSYVIRLPDLLVIVATGAVAGAIAALVPARSIARVPVLAALNGRRPVGRVPRLLVPVGLVLFGGGAGLVAWAVAVSQPSSSGPDGSLVGLVAILGGLGILFGACCASPLVVDLAARAVTLLGGSPRLAARSLARARGRSAGVVTAIAVVGAAAVLVTTVMATREARWPTRSGDEITSLPSHVVHVTTAVAGQGALDLESGVSADLRSDLLEVLPGSRVLAHRKAIPDGRPEAESSAPGLPSSGLPPLDSYDPLLEAWSAPTIADEEVLALLGLSDGDRARLERAGILNLDRLVGLTDPDGDPLLVRERETASVSIGSPVVTTEAPRTLDPFASDGNGVSVLVTEEALSRWGLRPATVGVYVLAPADLTERQMRQLDVIRYATQDLDFTFLSAVGERPSTGTEDVGIFWERPEPAEVPVTLLYAAVVGVALLLTLLVVAIGLSLSATESRDERDVLVAVGARPRTLRRMAGVKAVILAGTGVALAVPTGLVPAWIVLREPGRPEAVPWVALALLLVAVPVIAGLLAWLSSTIAQRVHPVHASSFAAD